MAEGDEIGFSGNGWPQYRQEVERFVEIMKQMDARSYLEIGCLYGDTLHFIGSQMPKGSKIVAIDLPGMAGRRYKNTADHLQKAAADLRKTYGHKVKVIIGNSQHPHIVDEARKSAPFDAIFIDGDHSSDGVRCDWQNYGPMGRVIGFHDVCRAENKYVDGIRALYEKLAADHEHELLTTGGDRRGIGVIWN